MKLNKYIYIYDNVCMSHKNSVFYRLHFIIRYLNHLFHNLNK